MTDETIWDLAPHTAAKHEMLRRYLGGWFGIFGHSQHHSNVNLIDGFAGPGIYKGGEPGSPIIFIKTLIEHSAFAGMAATRFNLLFNERDKKRFDELERQIEDLRVDVGGWPANVKVKTANENFFELGEQLVGNMPAGKTLAPTFFFIDPFGYKDVPLSLIKKMMGYRGCEMLFYFDFNSVQRFAQSGKVDDALTAYFGTDEFLNAPPSGDPERPAYFHDLFERQLRSECNLTYLQSFQMIRKSGHTGYYLFFGTRNLGAFDKMKQAMWTIDPTGQFSFSDRFADEDVLFAPNPDTSPLRRALVQKFGASIVPIEQIEKWTVIETPFASNHIKRATLKPMEDAGLIRLTNPRPRRARGQYPAGSLVEFF